MQTFHVKTYGCQMNKHDSERVSGQLVAAGFKQTSDIEKSDIVIYLTCCVRKSADDRLYAHVADLKSLKKRNPKMIIAVGGCLAQKDKERMYEKLPHVDIVFGTYNQSKLIDLVNEAVSGKKVLSVDEDISSESRPQALRESRIHAWVPITVGCDNFCTYCVVPYVRGPERSYELETIINDISDYVDDEVKEVTLLGQNVNSYGRDLYKETMFAELLDRASQIKGLERIRFMTSHPKDLSDDVIRIVSLRENICSHFHLPIQSGSNRILRDMNRGYSREEYIDTAQKIKEFVDDASLTTDIMIGFPGETEEDFNDTLDIIKRVGFDRTFNFIFSERDGTKAAEFEGKIEKAVKNDRFNRLVEMQNDLSLKSNRGLIGTEVNLFVEGRSKKGVAMLTGRTKTNKLVHFSGEDNLIEKYVDIKIKEAYSFYLIGETL